MKYTIRISWSKGDVSSSCITCDSLDCAERIYDGLLETYGFIISTINIYDDKNVLIMGSNYDEIVTRTYKGSSTGL